MKSVKDMLGTYRKSYGDTVGSFGGALVETTRVPSGFFALDLATGGGFPKGNTSIVYGAESSNKTNTSLRTIANHQKLWPDQTCVFVDVEHALDPTWAKSLGVDTEKLVVLQPDYAEQAGDMIEGLLAAEDCGLVVLDSVAAFMTSKMAEKSLEDAIMGGPSVIMNRLCDKISFQIRSAQKQGRPAPTVLLLNQIRTKVGITYGSPFVMPGGVKQKFLAAMIVRISGKNIMDPKVSKVMPVAKESNFVLEKWKVPICATHGQFVMATMAHKGLGVGDCDDFATVSQILKSLGMLVKHDSSGWLLEGHHYPTLIAARERFYAEPTYALGIKAALIEKSMQTGGVPSQDEDEE